MMAVAGDQSIPIDPRAVELWMADLDRRSRWIIRPLLQAFFIVLLHVTWAFKRLPLPQFRAHAFLQRTICFFCRNFVSPEANELIIRHYTTESNLLNFLLENAGPEDGVEPIELYPHKIDDMQEHSFVKHDQELFRLFYEYGDWNGESARVENSDLKWSLWRNMEIDSVKSADDLISHFVKLLDPSKVDQCLVCVRHFLAPYLCIIRAEAVGSFLDRCIRFERATNCPIRTSDHRLSCFDSRLNFDMSIV